MVLIRSLITPTQLNSTQHNTQTKMIGDYLIEKHIGEGTFGSVKLGVHSSSKKRVAIKLTSQEEATKEFNFLKTLNHPNVIKPIELVTIPMNLRNKKHYEQALVLEYMEGGDLLEYISTKGPLDEKTALKFLIQLMSALSHCHRMRIAHRDLKPENLLIDTKTGNIVLTDFGLSSNYNPNQFLTGRVGSLVYCAPELLWNIPYVGPEVDIWSAGVVLYAMLSGCVPWEGTDQATQIRNAAAGKFYKLSYVSREMGDLIASMLCVSPRARPTADDLLKHLGAIQKIYEQPRTIPDSFVALEEDGEYSNKSSCDILLGADSDGMEEDGESFESPPGSPKEYDLRIIPGKELKASFLYIFAFVEIEVLCQSIQRALGMLNVKFETMTRKKTWVADGFTKCVCTCPKSSFEVEICQNLETGTKVIMCQNVNGDVQEAKTVMNNVFNKCPFL